MKTLKVILWVLAVMFLLSFVQMILPWDYINRAIEPFGMEALPDTAMIGYLMRVMMACAGLIGIFLLIMARNPRKYLKMVKLVGWALAALGVYMLVLASLVFEFANFWYYVDPIFCLIVGVAILWLTKKMKVE